MADLVADKAEETDEAEGGPDKEKLRGQKAHKRWAEEIKFYETQAKSWETRSDKIVSRYKDDRKNQNTQNAPRFNVLWSNVQTLRPAVYARTPKPDIERRYRDKDDIGRVTSMVLERAITFFVNEEFSAAMKCAVLDRLLPGRGVMWARYEPHFRDEQITGTPEVRDDGLQITDSLDGEGDDDERDESPETMEVVDREDVCFDYVNWKDFGHTFGRTWDEVGAGWRKVYLTREQLCKRFGDEKGDKVPLDYTPKDLKEALKGDVQKKATIYEIWDKEERKAIWLHIDCADYLLDEQDDPLKLENFWPFPRPLFATLGNDDLIPVPDYAEYQDQAIELDTLTARIGAITKAIKVAGVYDKNAEGVQRLLAEGVENQLIPVEQWAMFGEKGGLKGVTDLLPMADIVSTLLSLYDARDKVKQDLYEICGIADILRGSNDAAATATAERIKGHFGTLRLSEIQDDVQRFARDLVKIGTEIIAKHFSLETLQKISGVKLLTEQEKMMLQPWHAADSAQTTQMKQNAQKEQQQPNPMMGHNGGPPMGAPAGAQQTPASPAPIQGQPPAPPQTPAPAAQPVPNSSALLPQQFANIDPEELREMMDEPSWEEVYQLLHDEPLLAYKIDIETDSTIKFDEDNEREARVQFLGAVSTFISAAVNVQNPDLSPLLAKLLMFGVRGFKVGKELESAFEVTIRKLEKDAENPSKAPSPEMMKVQADQQLEQQKMQREDARIQLQAQTDNQQATMQAQFDKMKLEMENQTKMALAKLDAETRIVVAQIAAKTSLKSQAMTAGLDPEQHQDMSMARVDIGDGKTGPTIQDLVTQVVTQLQGTLTGMQASHAMLAQAITKPRQVMRDPTSGDIVGLQ